MVQYINNVNIFKQNNGPKWNYFILLHWLFFHLTVKWLLHSCWSDKRGTLLVITSLSPKAYSLDKPCADSKKNILLSSMNWCNLLLVIGPKMLNVLIDLVDEMAGTVTFGSDDWSVFLIGQCLKRYQYNNT